MKKIKQSHVIDSDRGGAGFKATLDGMVRKILDKGTSHEKKRRESIFWAKIKTNKGGGERER